jgi:hypothetical protein
MDNVASGAVKYISTLSAVTSLLGSYPSNDPVTPNASKPWVFNEDLFQVIEGTGQAAIVCSDAGHYSVAPPMTTPQHLRLAVRFWVDPLRDGNGNITETSGATIARGKAIFVILNTYLHRISGDAQMWGDMRTATSQLLTGPLFYGVEDVGRVSSAGSGLTSRPQTGVAYYGVSEFGYSDAVS